LAAGDATRLRNVAHTFKGAVSHFGSSTCHKLAEQLESQGHSGKLAEAAVTWGALESALRRLLPALAAYRDGNTPSST
jgi:HPt (histidine-containing phosphotransfer) domain-containing protein